MDDDIAVVPPDTAAHDYYQKIMALPTNRGINPDFVRLYNGVAKAYNDSDVDAFLVLQHLANKRLSNLERIFRNRGLERDVDYKMFRLLRDPEGRSLPKEERALVMMRLSESFMREL